MNSKFCIGTVTAVLLSLGIPLGGCAATPKTESAGQFVDDSAITTKVKAKLLAEPKTSAYRISVETYKGVVQLSGFVDSTEEKAKAEEVVRSVSDVRSIRNNLVVKVAAAS